MDASRPWIAFAAFTLCIIQAQAGPKLFRPVYSLTRLVAPTGAVLVPHAINDRGQILGSFLVSRPGEPEAAQAVIWEQGEMRFLDIPLQIPVCPHAINDRGQVILRGYGERGTERSWLWERGNVTDLGTLGGPGSRAEAINNLGQVTGLSWDAMLVRRPFFWENGRMTALETRGRLIHDTRPINDRGEAVGWLMEEDGDQRAMLWRERKMVELPPAGEDSRAYDINDAGDVVGSAYLPEIIDERRAFLWQAGTAWDLNECVIPRRHRVLTEASLSNNRGEIVAQSAVDPENRAEW